MLESGTRGLRTTRYEVFLRCFLQPLLFVGFLLAGRQLGYSSLALVWASFALSLAVEVIAAELLVARLFPTAPAPEGEASPASAGTSSTTPSPSRPAGSISGW